MKLTYNDQQHSYYLDGVRAKSVTSIAKIPVDQYAIQMWHQRMVAIGTTIDTNLRENVALNIDNNKALNELCEEAKKAAKAHHKADRGSQMHRVLELILLDQEHKLLTDQQRRDADTLKRTLDRYKLAPYDYLTEQFAVWPHYTVAGRFDAVLERSDGSLILADLKSGSNAVTYPQSTAVQLALYARAPHISDHIRTIGDKSDITDWRTMPDRLNLRYGYVLLVEPDAKIGTFHEIDIEHGWAGAQQALRIVEWQKALNRGKDIAREIPPEPPLLEQATAASTLSVLREIWAEAQSCGALTQELRAACTTRSQELKNAMA